jgi:hypothetical protein
MLSIWGDLNMSIPILNYHQISKVPSKPYSWRSLHVDTDSFEFQMKFLKNLGYEGKSIRDLMPYLKGDLKGKVVGITFDDGYANNLYNALPILNKYNYTATCYFVSQKLGSTNSWDKDLNAVESSLMNSDELLKWHQSGNEVGSHTQRHSKLTTLLLQEAGLEIKDSKNDLEQIIGQSVDAFCYPYGSYFDEHIDLVTKSGYKSAVTTIRGKNDTGSDLMKIKRIPITCYTSIFHFALKILTGYEDRKNKKMVF